jgi:hypothetical protein
MLHTIAGKILKSSYFWLSENPGCYIVVGGGGGVVVVVQVGAGGV